MKNLLEENIKGSIGVTPYLCSITWRNGVMVMDEPTNVGGKDLGPDPYTTLLASLAGCTLSTLRMYIDRKEWDIPSITVEINMYQETEPSIKTVMNRQIFFSESTTEEQKERLLMIASKCPVSKILQNNILINTTS